MHIDTRKIGGQPSDDRIDVARTERPPPGPCAVIPPVPPHRSARVGHHVLGDQCHAVFATRGSPQIQSGELQTGGGQVDMRVDERRCDKRAVKIDSLGVGELRPPHRVVPQPSDHPVAHRHRGGIRV